MPDIGGHPIDPRHTDTDLLGLRTARRPVPTQKVSQSQLQARELSQS